MIEHLDIPIVRTLADLLSSTGVSPNYVTAFLMLLIMLGVAKVGIAGGKIGWRLASRGVRSFYRWLKPEYGVVFHHIKALLETQSVDWLPEKHLLVCRGLEVQMMEGDYTISTIKTGQKMDWNAQKALTPAEHYALTNLVRQAITNAKERDVMEYRELTAQELARYVAGRTA